jgi:hypothetical protein
MIRYPARAMTRNTTIILQASILNMPECQLGHTLRGLTQGSKDWHVEGDGDGFHIDDFESKASHKLETNFPDRPVLVELGDKKLWRVLVVSGESLTFNIIEFAGVCNVV